MGAGNSNHKSVRGAAIALVSAVVLTALPGTAVALDSGRAAPTAASASAWQGSWAASPQSPAAPFSPNWSQEGFANQTVRQVVRVTQGGTKARIELSNRYGKTPLRIAGATIARTDKGAAVQAGSVRNLTFRHGRSLTIPAGGTALSDGVPFEVAAFESVSVTLYLAAPSGPSTFHHVASATSFRAAGDHRADRGGAAFKETSDSWYFLTGVEVSGGHGRGRGKGVVTFGDSITDGVGSTRDANGRYPDKLAERLAKAGQGRAVLNHGISGNQVVNDTTWAGEKGIARFKKDVLSERGIGTVIVLEGINDIGASLQGPPIGGTPEVSARQLIEGHRSLIRQAHARGLKVIGATLTPIKGSFYDDPKGINEAKRDAVNAWIRGAGEYDAVVDFDRAVSDPADRDRMLPAYDSGDKLHPSDAGYVVMAEALDLTELR